MSQLRNCEQAFDLLKIHFNPYCEEFWTITLDTQLKVINTHLIARGTLNFCSVHLRDVFRAAIGDNCHSLIVAHNHPSGNTQPTTADIKLTKRLIKASRLLEIPILDHIVFTNDTYFSFKKSLNLFSQY